MIAYDDYRTGFRPFSRRLRSLRAVPPSTLVVDIGEPAPFPVVRPADHRPSSAGEPGAAPVAAVGSDGRVSAHGLSFSMASLVPGTEAKLLRRLRHVVRRRVRVDLDDLVSVAVTDGELALRVDTVSARDPRVVQWTADRLVALVVLHDGCGARVIGGGGLMGRLQLPSVLCAGAFLAFCYDAEATPALS